MNLGKYVFAQIVQFLPKRYFERLVIKNKDRTARMAPSCWSHMLVIMYGQLIGCHSLRELTDVTVAHAKRSFHLGFGKVPINRSVLSKANSLRDPGIFEKFAFYMVSIAQAKRITKEFELHGRFYAIDSTTIDLCMSVFRWAKFRSTKSGIKIHTQIDIATEIPVFYRISHANVHDTRSMDWFIYERHACYVFDRGYFDLSRLYAIEQAGAFFIIREKSHPDYEITEGEDLLEGDDNVLQDQTVRFTGKRNSGNYPVSLRRIVFYAPDLGRTFIYYTNNFYLKAKEIALLYRYRWQVELFSNGSSSIFVLNPFGVNLKMQSEYRYMSQSSPTVWSPLLNTTSNWTGLLLRSCVSLAIPCWSKIPFKNSWLIGQIGTVMITIANCIWTSN